MVLSNNGINFLTFFLYHILKAITKQNYLSISMYYCGTREIEVEIM